MPHVLERISIWLASSCPSGNTNNSTKPHGAYANNRNRRGRIQGSLEKGEEEMNKPKHINPEAIPGLVNGIETLLKQLVGQNIGTDAWITVAYLKNRLRLARGEK